MRLGPPDDFAALLCGQDWQEFQQELAATNWQVCENRRGRTSAEKERWTLKQALLSEQAYDWLDKPLPPFRLAQGDRPDIWLDTGSGTIGIEIAELVPEVVAKARSVAQELGLDVWHPPKTKDFPAHPSRKVLAQNLLNSRAGSPWLSYEPEKELAAIVCKIVAMKIEKSADYAKTDKLFLLLYDNSALPIDCGYLARSGALDKMSDRVRLARCAFKHVAVLCDSSLLIL
ncbi:MAG: hypothetical protein JSR87_01285 [Proteobacteria bacterium]|nr:hypothetical protein [Pseudomonadota bacterium]MBS0572608.1 hypothetical protein [Pseudomonadota bacterium]